MCSGVKVLGKKLSWLQGGSSREGETGNDGVLFKGGKRGWRGSRGEGIWVSVVGAVVVNAGHCVLAGSQAVKPWQLVSLCVTDLIDHKPDYPHLPFPPCSLSHS